jgi:hypothetical protein
MSARDSSNTHEVISELFRAMNTPTNDRAAAKLPRWAEVFPYVNGGPTQYARPEREPERPDGLSFSLSA